MPARKKSSQSSGEQVMCFNESKELIEISEAPNIMNLLERKVNTRKRQKKRPPCPVQALTELRLVRSR